MKVPTIMIGPKNPKSRILLENENFLNMWVGHRNGQHPVSEWPTGLEIASNINKSKKNKKYLRKKDGSRDNKKI